MVSSPSSSRRLADLLIRFILITASVTLFSACALWHVTSYSVLPDYPEYENDDRFAGGVQAPVEVSVHEDGRYRIEAENEIDLYYVTGYLQARDRMFQMDLLRHTAQGRLAELIGDQPLGEFGTALDMDRFNRFLGLAEDARTIEASLSAEEQAQAYAFAAGVNRWIDEGQLPIEHRLLGVDGIREWSPQDSLSIFRFLMFGLTHNWSREVRRLLVACTAGLDAQERIWPNYMEWPAALPDDAVAPGEYDLAPAVVPEMRAELKDLCPSSAPVKTAMNEGTPAGAFPLALLRDGLLASNNWAVSGSRTAKGTPILENDPHLPHMKPAIVWGMHHVLPDREVVGFTLPGIHLVVFGHNQKVSWGATINPVDLQDLYVEKPAKLADGLQGYLYDGEVIAFEKRTERFEVLGGDPVTATARYTLHGPVLNDLDSFLDKRIPLTALRTVKLSNIRDASAIREVSMASNVTDYAQAIDNFDSACINWVYADVEGNIGFSSPCLVPIRPHSWGTFPVPGWLSKYEWQGFLPKEKLPRLLNPERGWIATANSQLLPFNRMPTVYNNDPNPANRFLTLQGYFSKTTGITAADMANVALFTEWTYWPKVREALEPLCSTKTGDATAKQATAALCDWDGRIESDSAGATMFEHLTNAMLDRTLADDFPGGAANPAWRYLQAIPHFEAQSDWTWNRPATDPVWDDVRTAEVEGRTDILAAALSDAIREARLRYGDEVAEWTWGDVRPFFIRHPFGAKGGIAGALFNGEPMRGTGGPETVFKNQFTRADRAHMHPSSGPAFRMIVDMGDPSAGTFALAGGQSGWTMSPHYENLTADWMVGRMRPLTPSDGPGTMKIRFVPTAKD